jgi:hypothetical protein
MKSAGNLSIFLFYRAVQCFGFDPIKLGDIRVQNHVLSAESYNEWGELLGDEGGGCQF